MAAAPDLDGFDDLDGLTVVVAADEGEAVHGDIRELLAVRPVRVLALPQARHGQAPGGRALI